jgi:predicted Zn-dependent protease
VTAPLDVAGAALSLADGDAAEAIVSAERSGLARFAASEVHQPTLIEDLVVQLRILRDGRAGIAVGNRVDSDGLRELARRAGEAADAVTADPELPLPATPVLIPEVAGYDEETAMLPAEELAHAAGAAIAGSGAFAAYGFVTSGTTELAIASTAGMSVARRGTDMTVLVLAAGEDASGYAGATAWAARAIAPGAVAREAAAKAARTSGAVDLAPGRYAAVLEPYAVAELLQTFAGVSFGALELLEERSFLSGRLGERLFDPKLSIADDALDPAGLPRAFDFEGCPTTRVPIVEGGVARGVVWDRRTAARAGAGHATTGHAPPPSASASGPQATALVVEGGEAGSTCELAELVGEGIYVTRVHYIGVVDPRAGILTGTTRDGTFRIRGGKLAEPLVNLRFTISMPELLADLPGLTRTRTLVNQSDFYGPRDPVAALVPGLATASFTITGSGARPGL